LRLQPLLVEAGFDKVAIGQQIGRACHVADVAQQHRTCRGVELGVMFPVELDITRLDAECVDDVDGPAYRVTPNQCARLRAEELRGLVERLNPLCAIKNRVVDFTDKQGNVPWTRHSNPLLETRGQKPALVNGDLTGAASPAMC